MKISILIPTLNNVEYMKIIIPAIRKHTVNPYEILVHANCFSKEMEEYAMSENFDLFEYSYESDGVARSVNSLARQATGDTILFTGDDVYMAPGWDEALVRKLNDDIFYQYLTVCIFEPRWNNPLTNSPFNYGRTPETWQEQKFLSEWWDLRQIKKDIVSNFGMFFIKKKLWDRMEGYDEAYWPGYCLDPDLVAKIYFSAKKENQPYEFRGVADSGMYHFQCISSERQKNAKFYRQKAHGRFKQKWGMTVKQLNELMGVGQRL